MTSLHHALATAFQAYFALCHVTHISGDLAEHLSLSKKIYNKMTMKSRRMLTLWGQKMAAQAAAALGQAGHAVPDASVYVVLRYPLATESPGLCQAAAHGTPKKLREEAAT